MKVLSNLFICSSPTTFIMTRIISVISGKGGVGKTTTVTNLGTALAQHGKNIIVLDANVTTPNLSLHLGIPFYPVTLHDVLKKRAPISTAIYDHYSGIRVVPASLSVNALKETQIGKLQTALLNLLGQTDIIIVDSAPGLGEEALAAMGVADEVLIVTNPELPAVTDALRTIKLADEIGTRVLGIVVNRVKGHKHEMSKREIELMLDAPIIGSIPEDVHVPKSISLKTPVVHYKPRSKSSREFRKLAAKIIGEPVIEKGSSLLDRLFFWLS